MAERKLLIKADEVSEGAARFSHPWNPNSEIVGSRLSAMAGLSRIGVSRICIPAGKESFVYHLITGKRSGSTSSPVVASRR